MKRTIVRTSLFVLGFSTYSHAQALLSGRVSDVNGGAISQVKVTAVSKDSVETVVTTDDDGSYTILLASNIVLLKFHGANGFRNI